MRAIAAGHRTYGAIKTFADIDIQRQLDRLLALELVERQTPVTEDPSRTKRSVYRIADNFLASWFRSVYPNRADIARGLGRQVVDRSILPNLSDHMGEPWEEICREFVRDEAARGRLPRLFRVGRRWHTDHSTEIDVVGMDGRRVGRSELDRLLRATESLPNRSEDLHLVLFARETVEGIDDPDVSTYTAADLHP